MKLTRVSFCAWCTNVVPQQGEDEYRNSRVFNNQVQHGSQFEVLIECTVQLVDHLF